MQVSMPHFGCNTFQVIAADGSVIIGRAMDYPNVGMNSQILAVNREEACKTTAPDGQNGLDWTSKYGFIGVNAFGLDCYDDGINEMGLSYAILTLPETVYQTVKPDEDKIALPVSQLGKWILGNFGSVPDVETALKTVKIWGDTIPQINQVPKVHVAINDSAGKNLAIEFLHGEVKVHKNPIGVLTNEPPLEDHLKQLRFYNFLSSQPAPNTTINGHPVASFLETGLDGMPGGFSSPSRYVQIATHIRLMTQPQAYMDAVANATRLLGRLDIIPGMVALPFNNQTVQLSTQWNVVKDLTHKMLYFKVPGNGLSSIDLTQTAFEPGSPHNPIPLSGQIAITPIKI